MNTILRQCLVELERCLKGALPELRLLDKELHENQATLPANACPSNLTVGLANPSNSGFSDRSGLHVRWSTLFCEKTGVLATVKALDLDVLALPGARVPTGLQEFVGNGYRLVSRGGTSQPH